MLENAYILDSIRTPRGKLKNGSLNGVKPIDLISHTINQLLKRNSNLEKEDINDLILGISTPIGEQGANLARTAVLTSELNYITPGLQINRFCASGLESIKIAAQRVISGWDDLIIAGGVESMSRVTMGSDGGPMFQDIATGYDTYFVPQGISADLIATVENFSRNEVDNYAFESQKKAAVAWNNNFFKNAIVPVYDKNEQLLLDNDEHRRPETTLENLNDLKPAFTDIGKFGGFDAVALQKYFNFEKINHVHTAGNSSGIADAASITLIGNKESGIKNQLQPKAKIIGASTIGSEPTIMLTGPSIAASRVLKQTGLSKTDIDLWLVNEAFSAVVLKFIKDLQIDSKKVNPNGGAIALGHPLGATGSILISEAVEELHRTDKRYALITLCVAGGMGIAMIIEKVDQYV